MSATKGAVPRIALLLPTLALLVAAAAVTARAQGSQHALRFFGGAVPGQDRVVLAIDDDQPGPDASAPADVGDGDFTAEFWLKGTLQENPTANGGGDREYFVQNWKQGNVVVDREIAGAGAASGAEFGIAIAGGFVRFGTGRGAVLPFDPDHTLEGSVNVLDGTWHHVACVRDAASGVKRILVDGTLDVASSDDVSRADLSYPDGGAAQGGHPPSLVIAADAYDAGAAGFRGRLDELRLWSRALTASQVLSRFDRAMPSLPPGLAWWLRLEEGQGSAAADSSAAGNPPAAVVSGQPGAAEWTAYASDPSSCAPIGFGVLPPGFQRTTLTEQLVQPTALEFLPDGRALIAERGGAIKLYDPASGGAPTPAIQLAVDTTNGERGALGLAVHPQFAANGWFYVFHTSPEPRDRVSRFTLSGTAASPSSELVVWEAPAPASAFHHGGAIGFASDGKLLIALGDQLDSVNAQNLATPFGKLLRLNANGSIPPGNPFLGVPGADPAIFARGFRNPFRFAVDSATGEILVGDVGGNTTAAQEEVDSIVPGANFGWPHQEGESCYLADCSAFGAPLWSYRHDDPDHFVFAPQGSVTLGPVYRATQFPAAYHGNVFVADYANRSIHRLVRDAGGAVVAAPAFLWPGLGRTIVDLDVAPDGSLWYLAYGVAYGGIPEQPGLLRIDWIGSANAPPVVAVAASPQAGSAPLQVPFSAAGTFDPDAGPAPLAWSWSFGDGQFSSAPGPTHVYAANGKYVAQLTVGDGAASATSDPLAIEVGSKPQPVIAAPLPGATYEAGDVVAFSGAASDAEDGALPVAALAFEVLLVHADHIHPFLGPLAAAQGSFTVPATGHSPANTHFVVRLTATDSDGLSASTSVELHPDAATLAFATLPPGIPLTLDGEPVATPHVEPSLDDFQHSVAAPLAWPEAGGSAWMLRCWTDGGAAAHSVVAPEGGLNLTAVYDAVAPVEVLLAVPASDRNAQHQAATGVKLASPGDPAALALGRDFQGGIETAFEFVSPLPKGALVLGAALELTGTGNGFGQPACPVRAYAVADAPPFVAGSATPLTQLAPLTAASVTWTIPQMAAGATHASPDLSLVVQEVVGRSDYAPGARLGLVLDGKGNTLPHWWNVQRFGAASPPRLRVRYVVPAPVGGAPCAAGCGFATVPPGPKAADRLGLVGSGSPQLGGLATILTTGLGSAPAAVLFVSLSPGGTPFYGGTLLVGLTGFLGVVTLPAVDGVAALPLPIVAAPQYAGLAVYFQSAAADPSQAFGVAMSNGLKLTLCP